MKRSEDLANQEEIIDQAEETLTQAKGSLFPSVEGTLNFLKQPSQGGLSGTFSPGDQTLAKVTAIQPLFRGFREFAAIRQQKDVISAGRYSRDQATLLVFQDVVQNFYQVLSLEKDLVNLENEIIHNKKRLSELENFRRLGRSRETEVLTTQSNIAALEAQKEAILGQLNANRDIFSFLTGLSRTTYIQDSEKPPERKQDLEYYLSRVELRPDVRSQKKVAEAYEEGITIARGAHFPSVDVLGNYYFVRPGLLSGVNWDLQLGLTIPIFRGGVFQSQVRQAASMLRGSELALSKTRRLAIQQIETLFHQLQSEESQMEKQKKATVLAMKNYKAQLRDYRLGLVTNLEVLTSLTASQSNQRLLDRIQFQLITDFHKLEAAAVLKPIVAIPDSTDSKDLEPRS